MDVIVFGTGEIGKSILPFLDKNYHILFFVDNSKKKWDTVFEGYSVKCPNEITKYNCDVVIASTKYGIEILGQLKEMGVEPERIFFGRRFKIGSEYRYVVYPLNVEKIPSTGKSLIQYDLYHVGERQTSNKKVLIFCSFYSVYFKQLIESISARYDDIEFSLLTTAKESKENVTSKYLKHIYCYQTRADLKTIFDQLPVYDAMHLLWMEKEWVYFYRLIREKTNRLVLNIGGSDFYRATMTEREFRRNLIACADRIMGQTKDTVRNFVSYYGEEIQNKTYSLPYGVEVLEQINRSKDVPKKDIKERYNIPTDKIVVTCGHNASKAHQHIEMIEAIDKLSENIKEQIVCILPMTYPQGFDDYISRVKDKLKEIGLAYVILTEFMDFKEMAEYALISDIMIHVQTTDQLSSTMLEEMYAGSIVIAGKWLPYQSLHEAGMFFLDVNTISDITVSLEDVIKNIDTYKQKCVANRELVWKQSSWDEVAPKWHALWS